MTVLINIDRGAYKMTSEDEKTAEVMMYGQVVETRPTDWWTGESVAGDFICQDEFLADLQRLNKCRDITIRMNSVGGDAIVGITIHNRLRELARAKKNVKCVVDGVAMSAGSIIMCACDTVTVNKSSLIMIHGVKTMLWGYYSADDLETEKQALDQFDAAAASIYARKTGLQEQDILGMMSDTTYMTGADAVEKHFADEMVEDDGPEITASADGRSLYVKGRQMRLYDGFAPDFIPTVKPDVPPIREQKGELPIEHKEEIPMTLDELKAQAPELLEQLKAEADAGTKAAVEAERSRLAAIDEIADLLDPTEVEAAKYGENKMTAEQLLMQSARRAKAQGRKFLQSVEEDYIESGAANVNATGNSGPEMSPAVMDYSSISVNDIMADLERTRQIYTEGKGK